MNNRAFTLIELLIVIGIIAILAAAIIVAISPGQQLAQARNTTRRNHINSLQTALYAHYLDENEYPGGINEDLQEICHPEVEEVNCDGVYLGNTNIPIPVDPHAQGSGTGYEVMILGNKISFNAKHSEIEERIVINLTLPYIIFQEERLYIYPVDNSGSINWGPTGNETGATFYNDGKSNTANIIENMGGEHPAAELCNELDDYGIDEWFLPSRDELVEIYTQWNSGVLVKGSFEDVWADFTSSYWLSSTEVSEDYSRGAFFGNGNTLNLIKSANYRVRCVSLGN